jgi:hypothetical protein
VLLHSEEMRGQDKTVPRVLREYSRGEDVLERPGLGGPDAEVLCYKLQIKLMTGRRKSK